MKNWSNLKNHTMIGIACMLLLLFNANASLIVENTPRTILRNEFSEINRPEGVTYSPDGKYIATANSLINTVTFYQRIDKQGAAYENTPAFSIKGEESQLNYPHDVAFSPDGCHLAVANRVGNSITIYEKNNSNDTFNNIPIAVIEGGLSGVTYPDSVRYSPTHQVIAVANLGNSSINFYYYNENVYQSTPYQIIKNSLDVLHIPDSLDFSMDGELLAVTSHDTHAVLIYQHIQDSDGLYTSQPVEIIQGPETNFHYPHSVSFHPTQNYLIVSSSEGQKNINIFQKTSDTFPRYGLKPIVSLEVITMYEESTIHLLGQLHQEGGCKGVSFSPDGTSFALTQNLSADQMQLPYSVGVLLVYSIKIDEL